MTTKENSLKKLQERLNEPQNHIIICVNELKRKDDK